MHQGLFLLLPAFRLASSLVVPNGGSLHPNASTIAAMAHPSQAAKGAQKVVQENGSSAPNHNIRMFLIIFGAISGFMFLSVAIFFARALFVKKRYQASGKKGRGGGMPLSRSPKDRRVSTDSGTRGLTNDQQSLGAPDVREKDSGSWREEVIPPRGHVYQEVPTEEAGGTQPNYAYHPPPYPGPNSRALEERYAPYEGRPNRSDSRGSVRRADGHGKPTMPANVIQ